jgi:hypothetical protein
MTAKIFKKIFTLFPAILLVTFANTSLAANFSVAPLIIDVDAEVRESFNQQIKLSSHNSNAIRLYASVHEIDPNEVGEIKSFVPASMSDRTTSVTSWIQITRSRIDLKPGEEKEVPLLIKINPNTPPGLYHAFVGFAQGANRDIAEATILSGQGSGVVLRISVGGKQEEFLRLVSFTTDRFSYTDTKGQINYTIQNTGDVPLSPSGDVIIYDSRGRELTTVELNKDGNSIINPGETVEYKETLPYLNRLGKNKAYLSLEYGQVNRASVYDTYFYYSVPWFYLVIIVLLLATVLTVLILLFRRGAIDNEFDEHEARDIPLFVRDKRDHSEYEHDIDLKKKDS